jgi:hypothetical protein
MDLKFINNMVDFARIGKKIPSIEICSRPTLQFSFPKKEEK